VLTVHGFDFVVGAFERTVGDGVFVPGQDAVGMSEEGAGEVLEDADAGVLGLVMPVEQLQASRVLAGCSQICLRSSLR